jgi:hypothetical protein
MLNYWHHSRIEGLAVREGNAELTETKMHPEMRENLDIGMTGSNCFQISGPVEIHIAADMDPAMAIILMIVKAGISSIHHRMVFGRSGSGFCFQLLPMMIIYTY